MPVLLIEIIRQGDRQTDGRTGRIIAALSWRASDKRKLSAVPLFQPSRRTATSYLSMKVLLI